MLRSYIHVNIAGAPTGQSGQELGTGPFPYSASGTHGDWPGPRPGLPAGAVQRHLTSAHHVSTVRLSTFVCFLQADSLCDGADMPARCSWLFSITST